VAEPAGRKTRREAVVRLARAAGVALPVLGFLEGRVDALPRGEETDMAVLGAALAIEHEAIALYDRGLEGKLFPPGLRSYAVEFRGDHLGHRDTQVAIVEERGGRPPSARPATRSAPSRGETAWCARRSRSSARPRRPTWP
jgi:ferritin-like protein